MPQKAIMARGPRTLSTLAPSVDDEYLQALLFASYLDGLSKMVISGYLVLNLLQSTVDSWIDHRGEREVLDWDRYTPFCSCPRHCLY